MYNAVASALSSGHRMQPTVLNYDSCGGVARVVRDDEAVLTYLNWQRFFRTVFW